jgi:hypothetical protein
MHRRRPIADRLIGRLWRSAAKPTAAPAPTTAGLTAPPGVAAAGRLPRTPHLPPVMAHV